MTRSASIKTFDPDPTDELNLEWTMRQFWRIRAALQPEDETIITTKIIRVSTTYTAQESDIVILADPTAGNFTITLKAGQDGRFYYIKNINTTNSNTVTIDPDSSESIDIGTAAVSTTYDVKAGDSIHIMYDSVETTWWII
jgi:hypothetical protein